MENAIIENIINILKSGKALPSSYQEILFPINNKEYTLQYKRLGMSYDPDISVPGHILFAFDSLYNTFKTLCFQDT